MPYDAQVYKVMIASPSDIAKERQVIRDVVHEWNAIHSEDKSFVLMPVGWESHASPQMGLRPQEVINRQVLKDCDLLIAAFWTRVGSPTGEYISGTIEEIEEHLSAGKPATIYFSSAPVHPDSVDMEQYQALKAFKESCRPRGLIESYDSLSEFREKVSKHLAQTVIRSFSSKSAQPVMVEPQRPSVPELLPLSKDLLLEASQDEEGAIMKLHVIGSLIVQTNNKEFSPETARDRAQIEAALNQLQNLGLIRDRSYKGEIFDVTEEGYQVADGLKTNSE